MRFIGSAVVGDSTYQNRSGEIPIRIRVGKYRVEPATAIITLIRETQNGIEVVFCAVDRMEHTRFSLAIQCEAVLQSKRTGGLTRVP